MLNPSLPNNRIHVNFKKELRYGFIPKLVRWKRVKRRKEERKKEEGKIRHVGKEMRKVRL